MYMTGLFSIRMVNSGEEKLYIYKNKFVYISVYINPLVHIIYEDTMHSYTHTFK